jgi:DNA-binding CsgD family transcriptional regulator
MRAGDRDADALAEARRLLGRPADDDADLDALLQALARRLEKAGDAGAMAAQHAHEAEVDALRRRCAGSAPALDRVRVALDHLRRLTSPRDILAAAARELSSVSELERVVVSGIREGAMVAEAVEIRGDEHRAAEALQALRAHPVRLEHPLIEAELLRRRRATIVTGAGADPRVDPTMTTIMGWDAYVAAPIAVRSSVIGVLHADRGLGRPLEAEHRDAVWEFALGLARVYDSATLRRTLRSERERIGRLLESLGERSRALSEAPLELVPRPATSPTAPASAADGERSARPGAEQVLTRRELEILDLLAEGRSNRAIADELVISPGTVKFHVNSILRKLRVANRAEAVSRYFALRGPRSRT